MRVWLVSFFIWLLRSSRTLLWLVSTAMRLKGEMIMQIEEGAEGEEEEG